MKSFLLLVGLAACQALAHAAPDSYPSKLIRLLVGYPAGGAVDTVARVLAEKLGPMQGQSVIVENRPGATGNIAGEAVAHAPADGYTLYMETNINPVSVSLFKQLSYDPVRDLAPVPNVVEAQTVLVSATELPIQSMKQLLSFAQEHPGKVSYASTGEGSTGHLGGVLLSNVAKGEVAMYADLVKNAGITPQ